MDNKQKKKSLKIKKTQDLNVLKRKKRKLYITVPDEIGENKIPEFLSWKETNEFFQNL